MNIWVEIIGWTGAACLLAAYGLVSAGRLKSRSLSYQFLNVAGSFGFIVNGWYHGAFPSVAMNVVWLLIAVAFILRVVRQSAFASDSAP